MLLHIGRRGTIPKTKPEGRASDSRAARRGRRFDQLGSSISILSAAQARTHPNGRENMSIDIQRPLMHARRQCWVEALRKAFGDGELVGDHLELRVALEALFRGEKRRGSESEWLAGRRAVGDWSWKE